MQAGRAQMPGDNTKRAKQLVGETWGRLPVSIAGSFSEPGIGFREMGYGRRGPRLTSLLCTEMEGMDGTRSPRPDGEGAALPAIPVTQWVTGHLSFVWY